MQKTLSERRTGQNRTEQDRTGHHRFVAGGGRGGHPAVLLLGGFGGENEHAVGCFDLRIAEMIQR